MAETAYNSSPHTSLGEISPFEAERGYPIRLVKSIIPPTRKRESHEDFIRERTSELESLNKLSDEKME